MTTPTPEKPAEQPAEVAETPVDPATQEQTKQKILSQVEFYFSDSNLLNDKFLFTTQQANDGWVPISTLSQFQRMKRFRPVQLIVDTLRESSEVLEVSEDGELVKRKAPLPKNHNEIQQAIARRSVVVKGFESDVTLDKLLAFFNAVGPTAQVRMRRKRKEFTGKVVVEFKDEAVATKFVEDGAKYDGKDLQVFSQVAYNESKARSFDHTRGRRHGKKGEDKTEEKDEDRKREESPKREEKKEDEKEYRDREDKKD